MPGQLSDGRRLSCPVDPGHQDHRRRRAQVDSILTGPCDPGQELDHTRRGAQIAGGSVRIGDQDVLTLGAEQQRRLRGRVVSYVPQDPASALNPALRIGTQLMEALEVHGVGGGGKERKS